MIGAIIAWVFFGLIGCALADLSYQKDGLGHPSLSTLIPIALYGPLGLLGVILSIIVGF